MPVLFVSCALRLFLAGDHQLVVVKADLDVFLVHAGKFGRDFEGIICFRHIDRRRTSANVGRSRFLIESTKRVFHFAPHHAERLQVPGSWSTISEGSSVLSIGEIKFRKICWPS